MPSRNRAAFATGTPWPPKRLPSRTPRKVEWYGAFFGIARVLIEGQDAAGHLVWFRNRDSTRHEAAADLARSISIRGGSCLKGVHFDYSQADAPPSTLEVATMHSATQRAKHPWRLAAPIIATSKDRRTKILLWWLAERYTMAEHFPEREHRFSYQSLYFDDDGSPRTGWASTRENPQSLTDCFLVNLTGKNRPKRTCLYIPDLPNGPDDSFIPVKVTEGSRNGILSASNFGHDGYSAQLRAQMINSRKGVTIADGEAISRRYREYEPYEEPFYEFSGFQDD